ncbi:MGMT family protein [Amedibacillus dolichus]|uniref:MGMT family protein n=1 Tax=Amedibacillus dolichus TaxID=31971 RepID=A0ABT7U8U5_9FIRM|nr:MGMT family protein [Amedibacillus dolichus]MDM8156024.1 MGMT family protein [Amedibacillus dolichus]
MEDSFAYLVLAIVSEIPGGKVATYQQIARLAGRERGARLVGRVLSHASLYGDYPCHRVVSSQGRTAPGWEEQRVLLEAEGVGVSQERNGRSVAVSMEGMTLLF